MKNIEPIELGNVSDWISSVCNIIMAGAAIIAMLKAQRWYDLHKQNTAIELVKSILLDYDTIKLEILRISPNLISIESLRNESDKVASLKLKVEDLAYECIELQHKLRTTARWGVTPKNNDVNSAIDSLLPFCNAAWFQFIFLEQLISSVAPSTWVDQNIINNVEKLKNIRDSISSNTTMQQSIDNLFYLNIRWKNNVV